MTTPKAIHGVLSAAAALSLAWGCVPVTPGHGVASDGEVAVWRIPDGGRLPQAVADEGGTVHLVYFQGEAAEGDLMYATRGRGAASWSEPLRVNSEPESVTGIGPIAAGTWP